MMENNTEQKKPSTGRVVRQLLPALLFAGLGILLLLATMLLFYRPMKRNNDILAEERLKDRMQLSTLIADVFPSMNVDDELTDTITRALENRKKTWSAESAQVAGEIEALRRDDAQVAELLNATGYSTSDFTHIVKDPAATAVCLEAVNHTVSEIDTQLAALGVTQLKQEIAEYKGTVTTVTKEDENGETVTETVIVGGLIPEAQAKKDELQKKFDEVNGKLTALDEYLEKVSHKITGMYNRLDNAEKTYDVFDKMEAITAYVKQNPENNVFMTDTAEKLASFPGESKEEDDILFMMKIEAETGIRMQQINYGQDYQLTKLSNGMLLCFEVYTIPYYATYQGVKNLIEYFNQNDDFYASVYTLTMQYNAMNETIQGNIMIMHYYLLREDAEYVPPVIDEEIIPGIDGIFGDVTDNGQTNGKQSEYTPDDVKGWLDEGKTLEEVRDQLKSEGYKATELAWILKEEYSSIDELQGFLDEYGEEGVEYDVDYVKDLLECDTDELLDIYYGK